MMVVLLFLVLLFLVVHSESETSIQDRCPVTGAPNFSKNGSFYYYPSEVYASDADKEAIKGSIQYCYGRENEVPLGRVNYSCPLSFVGCPVSSEHLKAATSRSDQWHKVSNLCLLKDYLNNASETITMLVLGTSVTQGAYAQGCCKHDPICFNNNKNIDLCTWNNNVKRFLEDTFPATIRYISLAESGYSSLVSSTNIRETLTDMGLTELDGRFMVFLDNSYTDMLYGEDANMRVLLEKALESLVRSLLHKVTHHHALPHIFLMEMDPRLNHTGYTVPYARVASHYGLRKYSYHDAVYGEGVSRANPLWGNLVALSQYRLEMHPPWHIHLFHADLFVASLMRDFSRCESSIDKHNVSAYALPKSQSGVDDNKQCNPNMEPVLKWSYESAVNQSVKSIGSYDTSQGVWSARLDKRGRGGFISELTPTSDCNARSMIVFTLNITVAQFLALPAGTEMILYIKYLRSYENAGWATVNWCESPWGYPVIDALWVEPHKHKHSLPQMKLISLKKDKCQYKERKPSEYVNVSITQTFKDCPRKGGNMTELMQMKPRGTQMIKIMSVGVCSYL